ncbi:alpha/beta hydrolase domain-containing protein [Amycolatopsis sp. cmx-11-32]|uniref:alpha/beta hydrolase domain-containing protein n=1 Tax=Amycolatopsis sp. cmx-11-32 TaxID=2785796 RepID=UPI0039E59E5B
MRTESALRRGIAAGLLAPVLAGLIAVPAAATPGGVLPRVTGPIAQNSRSHAFGAAAHQAVPENLAASGYTEAEYFLSGRANVYTWPAGAPAAVRTSNAPYTTRLLVRKPATGKRFSGKVVVEMLNPSNLFDLNIGWAMLRRQLIADGDAWVGITIKPVSVAALQNFDPVRYAPLSLANPLPVTDPANCANPLTLIPGDSSRVTENGLAWDIYSQVGALLRGNRTDNPLRYGERHNPPVQRLYGFGYSQTGGYLYNYVNGIQPLVVRATGRPLYDGYLVAVAGGSFVGAAPMNQCDPAPPIGDPRRQFDHAGTPILHLMSQSDYLMGIDSRRPDSDMPGDHYRGYEMAGAGHATPDELHASAKPADIVKAGRQVPAPGCDQGPRSPFPSQIFFDAALRNLDHWVTGKAIPPRAAPITVHNGTPATDRFGNVMGGLRSPYLDVPTATWSGTSTGPSFCAIAGHVTPLPAATLAQLYPTHDHYVRQVAASTARLVTARYITPADGTRLIREAIHAPVPDRGTAPRRQPQR